MPKKTRQLSASERIELERGQLEAVVESVDEAVISTTPDGIITRWNAAAERLLGYTPEEMIGRSVSVLVPADHADEETRIVERIHLGERIDHYQLQCTKKDGSVVDVVLTISPIKDRLGRIIGAARILKDVRGRRLLERAELDRSFLASIVSSATDAILSTDLHGVVTSWNPAAQKMFGYAATEIVGKPLSLLMPADRPDEWRELLEKIRDGQRIERYETQRARNDGSIIDIELTAAPIKDRLGQICSSSEIIRDITDHRRWRRAEEAESFLGALVESAEDAVVSKTLEGIVTSWNPAAERLFGYTASEMIGQSISILIPPEHANEEPEILERIRRGERIEHYETERVRKDGRIVSISLTVSPIKDRFGRVCGASKIARDITGQKEAEARERDTLRQAREARQQAEEAQRRAEQASRAKDDFLATVSHELRTPMHAILGWTSMLTTGQLTPEIQEKALQTIDRNARAQAQLIEDLLDISRIVSGKLRVESRDVDLAAVVNAAVEAVRPTAEARKVHIQFARDETAGPIVGDFQRLQQVVWNLLSNAIRFSPVSGEILVQLDNRGDHVELTVRDNGVGIKPEFLPQVFGRFTQADSSITRQHGGLGMGLAIVKSLVELHGGTVSASSPGPGLGAVFTVSLPVRAARPRVKDNAGNRTASTIRPQLDGLRILVVDDEPDTCELLRFIFKERGAITRTATGVIEALEILDAWSPNILVSDIGMPNIDGYELIRIVQKERGILIPAIALSARARVQDRTRALSAGYQMYVPKPVEPEELINIVAGLVGNS